MVKLNFVHLYVGDGKGKTTAALGLAVRAVGAGKKVMLLQFLKGKPNAELEPLKTLGITIMRAADSEKFVFQMDEQELEQCKKNSNACFEQAAKLIALQKYDMLILDEVTDAIQLGILEKQNIIELVNKKSVELVLTGHYVDEDIISLCDYVSEIKKIKHPYDSGIKARYGIEY